MADKNTLERYVLVLNDIQRPYKTKTGKRISYTRNDDDAWRKAKPGQKKRILVHVYGHEVRVAFDDPSLDKPRAVGFIETTCTATTGFAERLLINHKNIWPSFAFEKTLTGDVVSESAIYGYTKDGTQFALSFTPVEQE